MFGLSRRGLLVGLAAAGARPTAATKAVPSADPLLKHYTNVQDFGAKGNGVANDTRAIQAAIAATPAGGTVWFPPGTYVVRKTLVLKPGTTYRGSNPHSSVVQQAAGANLVAVMADENFTLNRPHSSSGIQIEDLGIDGNSAHNRRGHGLLLMVDRSLVRHVLVSFPPEAGIVLTDQDASGRVITNPAVENRIEDCTITQPGTYGVWVVDTHNSGRQTDGYLLNNIVKNSLGEYAMRIERAAGWFIAHNHIYHCAQNGFFLSHAECTYFECNEIDHFGLTKSPPTSYYGVQVEFLMGRLRPSVFIGNVCATWEGLYPQNLYTYYQFFGDQSGMSSAVFIGNATHNDPLGSPLRSAHAYGSIAFDFGAQPGGTLNVSAAANANDGSLTSDSIAKDVDVQLGATSSSSSTPLTIPLAAGLAGGVAVGGIGMAARSRRVGQQAAKVVGSNGPRASDPGQLPIPLIAVAETLSRWEIDPVDFTPDVGSLYLTYFVPFQWIDVSRITFATGDRAAKGATVSRVGVYEVLEAGELRLIGASGNGAGRFWTTTRSVTTVDLDAQFGPLPLRLVAGKPYAYAEIQVGGSPATRIGKVGDPGVMALEPRGSARYYSHEDLPPSLPPPSDVNASGLQFYARLTSATTPVPPGRQR